MSKYPPLVNTIEEFVYHQSQFMRDHFLLHTDLLEHCVRAIVPGLDGLTKMEIRDQFFAALHPQRRTVPTKRHCEQEAATASSKKKTKCNGFKRPKGRAPLGKTWDYVKGGWKDDTASTNKKQNPKPVKGPHPVPGGPRKKGCTWDHQHGKWVPKVLHDHSAAATVPTTPNTTATITPIAPSPSSDIPADTVHHWKPSELKKDERGLFKQPKGRPPLHCYWDRKVGQWREFPF